VEPKVLRLKPEDAERYARLRLRMLVESPCAFGASPGDDKGQDLPHVRHMLAQEEYAVFAVEAGPRGPASGQELRELIASAGIMRWSSPKFRHRATVWGVYVEPEHRGLGLGRAVMAAAIATARAWSGVDYVDLGVSAAAPEALRLYENLGFVAWGREPEATEIAGRRYDEIHMTLRVRGTGDGCRRIPSFKENDGQGPRP